MMHYLHLIFVALWFCVFGALPAFPQPKVIVVPPTVTSVPATPSYNFSARVQKAGVFQIVLAPAQNFQRRSILIQNNNAVIANCWIFTGDGTPNVAHAYLLTNGAKYDRVAPFATSNTVWGTCDRDNATLFIEAQ